MEHCNLRREWVGSVTGADLSVLGNWWEPKDCNTTVLKGNIEVPLGVVHMPVAAVGPMRVNGKDAKGDFFVPMATTEGALIASANRGVAMLREAGGVEAWTGLNRCNRAPVFVLADPEQALIFGEWARTKLQEIQDNVVCKHSKRGLLKELYPYYDSEVSFYRSRMHKIVLGKAQISDLFMNTMVGVLE